MEDREPPLGPQVEGGSSAARSRPSRAASLDDQALLEGIGSALRARQGRCPEASLQHAHLGAALANSEEGAARERIWQSHWLAVRLELDGSTRWGPDP